MQQTMQPMTKRIQSSRTRRSMTWRVELERPSWKKEDFEENYEIDVIPLGQHPVSFCELHGGWGVGISSFLTLRTLGWWGRQAEKELLKKWNNLEMNIFKILPKDSQYCSEVKLDPAGASRMDCSELEEQLTCVCDDWRRSLRWSSWSPIESAVSFGRYLKCQLFRY